MTRRGRVALKVAVWAACLAPLAWLLYRAATDDLTANPISFITNWLGDWTLRILLTSLAMTPLRLLFRWSWPVALRRLLGLFAFFYVLLHFSVWLVLDHFFAWGQMGADILKRPYITVGHGRPGADDPAGRHLHRRRDPAPRRARGGSGCTGWST